LIFLPNINIYVANNKTKKMTSSIEKTINTVSSTNPPTLTRPFRELFIGQNGFIPLRVHESAKRCKAYPKKKGKGKRGI